MERSVLCFECQKPIDSHKDLITTPFLVLLVKPFHRLCFSDVLKRRDSLAFKKYALNGFEGNLAAISGFIIAILLVTYAALAKIEDFSSRLIIMIGAAALLLIAPVAQRLYSYFKFEKPLIKRQSAQ